MDINGIWKGEYIVHPFVFPTGKEIPVPFVMKINSINEGKFIPIDSGLFEGICQDDPHLSKIAFHATVTGAITRENIYFLKQYPMLLVQNATGGITTYDQPHPEIFYSAEWKDRNEFRGSWIMNRTFRKIHGKLRELMEMRGTWWMRKC